MNYFLIASFTIITFHEKFALSFICNQHALGNLGKSHVFCSRGDLSKPWPPRRKQSIAADVVAMSKKDQRYKLAKISDEEDRLLLTVSERYRRREGQAQISWYPGHIAAAEKKLHDVLGAVDLVIEVRDARIPASTTHPMVDEWLKNRKAQRVVVMTMIDLAPRTALNMWQAYLENTLDTPVAFINGKMGGQGLFQLRRMVLKAAKGVNERRVNRGMLPRSVRAAVIGYPNVGKSAVINRLTGQKKAKSENRAGVTRGLQWISSEGFDLLDSPGIIPARLLSQEVAVRLAICDDIGEASYDSIVVAAALVDELRKMHLALPSFVDADCLFRRYGLRLGDMSGEEYIAALAQFKFFGLQLEASERLLDDWRGGRLGPGTLEPPPTVPHHTGYYRQLGLKSTASPDEIRSAYRSRARVLHPDVGGDRDAWQRFLDAYQVLSDEDKRKRYDAHGLVWDVKIGKYRVAKAGEAVPTIRSMTLAPKVQQRLLTSGRGEARVRKGMLTLPLSNFVGASVRRRLAAGPGPRQPPPPPRTSK